MYDRDGSGEYLFQNTMYMDKSILGLITDNNNDKIIGSITVTEMVDVLGTLYCMGGQEKVFYKEEEKF